MKKIVAILLSCLLIISSIPSASAQIDFDRLKQTILTGIDKSVDRLNEIESEIESNPEISNATKESLIDALNIVENGILSPNSPYSKSDEGEKRSKYEISCENDY